MKQKLRGTATPAALVERKGQCGFPPIAPAAATRTVETTDRPLPGEEFYRRSDLGRCELIEGTVKERPPATGHSHGRLEFRAAQRLGDFCREREVGEVMVGEVGIYTARDPDSIRAADVVLMSHDRLDRIQSDSFLDVPPELVVEITSPVNKWEEMHRKLWNTSALASIRSGSSSRPTGRYRSTRGWMMCRRSAKKTCLRATDRSMD